LKIEKQKNKKYVWLAIAKKARKTTLKINNPTPSATELWMMKKEQKVENRNRRP